MTAEHDRLAASRARQADWKQWGPYLSEREWGTVREDYSATGEAWDYFPHEHARSRAYRWGEDGIGGWCNRHQNICLSVAFWNEQDPILKERLFGLTGPEGNHGEDVKEYYFYLDSTPTHSYCKMLYKYPQVPFPYTQLVAENSHRHKGDPEYELLDALRSAFESNQYFDIVIEYAKVAQEDILCRITAHNRADKAAPLHILPHIWFRNTWSWGYDRPKPTLERVDETTYYTNHRHLGERWYSLKQAPVAHLFTDNETNYEHLFNIENPSEYVKDGINNYLVEGEQGAVNPMHTGTKAAPHYQAEIEAGGSYTVWVRFSDTQHPHPFDDFEAVFEQRQEEADAFYNTVQSESLTDDERRIQRQAFAGLMWSKQFYHYGVQLWLEGDPTQPDPPDGRQRNSGWRHLYAMDVLSMPDKWEYPWFAAWDTAFHMLPVALIDPEWAKRQLIILLREWYMHPNGQIPAYEWAFEDVNPPVHAWAAWRVYKIARNVTGHADTVFLEKVFHKLLLNFTWWVNREDVDGNNVFQGGFLGLDNIGIFDRSQPLPTGGHLEQADGTAWMGMYCLNMMAMALELARTKPAYEDVATKFFEHFIWIANAIQDDEAGLNMWDEDDGFFYDHIHLADGSHIPLKIRSFVGLIPLYAVETIEPDILEKLPRFKRRMEWFIEYRPWLVERIASLQNPGKGGRRLLSMANREQLERILPLMFNTDEFLSPYGLRSLSKYHEDNPFSLAVNDHTYSVDYEPGVSRTLMFGGNSNWRGPVWFPTNYLMIESLQKYDHYYGDELTVQVPGETGGPLRLREAAQEIGNRLIRIFERNAEGQRAAFGGDSYLNTDEYWRDYIPFYEFFHAEDGTGLGASHQTGWTALVAKLIQQNRGHST